MREMNDAQVETPRRLKTVRVMTVRLAPTEEQWKFLRQRASQAAAYRNRFMQAQLADALKWGLPQAATKDKLTKHIRATERGDLSSSVYSACETEVKKDWTRGGRKIMAGAPMPQYASKDALGFATITGRAGVVLVEREDLTYDAQLMVSGAHVEGGCWMTVPLHRGTKRDEHRLPMLHDMAMGKVGITMARVVFKLHAGKTLLQLTYSLDKTLPPMGERHATLSQLDNGRLVVRTDAGHVVDYTSRVHHLRQLKENWDAITRRWRSQIGKRRGAARLARRKNAQLGLRDAQNTHLHQWSREIVTWLQTQGVGTFSMALPGGDWAAHQLAEYLAYKCEEAGIAMVEPALDDASTARAVKAAEARQRRRAKKLGDAVREVKHQVG